MAKQTPFSRDFLAYEMTITTRWFDNDIYGHMNNSIHYQLFDTVVNGFLLDQKLLDMVDCPTVFLVVETGCQYFEELSFPDVITAGLRVSKIGTSSIVYDVALFKNENQTAAAQGKFVHVNVDRTTRRPEPITGDARLLLEKFHG